MIEPSTSGSSDSPRDQVFSAQEVTRFAALFSQFITTMQSHTDANGANELVDLLDAHLGASAKRMEPVGAAYPRGRWADVDLALDTLLPGEPVGVTGSHTESLGDLIEDLLVAGGRGPQRTVVRPRRADLQGRLELVAVRVLCRRFLCGRHRQKIEE